MVTGVRVFSPSSSNFLFRRCESTSTSFGGFIPPGFEGVKDAFKDNFRSGWDSKGAAFSVYKNGQLFVDLHGGFANTETLHKWEENTLANVFSCGKGVLAIAVAMLVDRYNWTSR